MQLSKRREDFGSFRKLKSVDHVLKFSKLFLHSLAVATSKAWHPSHTTEDETRGTVAVRTAMRLCNCRGIAVKRATYIAAVFTVSVVCSSSTAFLHRNG